MRDLSNFAEDDANGPKILAIANDMKAQLDAFKPFVPLVVGLRNPGMRDRHWDQVRAALVAGVLSMKR